MKLSDRRAWAKKIGENVRRVRTRAQLLQKDLARAMRTPQSHLSRLEHGGAGMLPKLDTLRDIAEAIPCTLSELLDL